MAGLLSYPSHRFVDDVSEFICSICTEVCFEAVTLVCGHEFCHKCITESLKTRGTCPNCNQISGGPAVPAFKARSRINGLRVKCQSSDSGCSFIDAIQRIELHEAKCELAQVDCQNCIESIQRKDLNHHQKEICVGRPAICKRCDNLVKLIDMDDHQKSVCLGTIVSCENKCGENLRRGEMSQHSIICGAKPVQCTLSSLGCRVSVPSNQLNAHLCDSYHFNLLHQRLIMQQAEIESLKMQQERKMEKIHSYRFCAVYRVDFLSDDFVTGYSESHSKRNYESLDQNHQKRRCIAVFLVQQHGFVRLPIDTKSLEIFYHPAGIDANDAERLVRLGGKLAARIKKGRFERHRCPMSTTLTFIASEKACLCGVTFLEQFSPDQELRAEQDFVRFDQTLPVH